MVPREDDLRTIQGAHKKATPVTCVLIPLGLEIAQLAGDFKAKVTPITDVNPW